MELHSQKYVRITLDLLLFVFSTDLVFVNSDSCFDINNSSQVDIALIQTVLGIIYSAERVRRQTNGVALKCL